MKYCLIICLCIWTMPQSVQGLLIGLVLGFILSSAWRSIPIVLNSWISIEIEPGHLICIDVYWLFWALSSLSKQTFV